MATIQSWLSTLGEKGGGAFRAGAAAVLCLGAVVLYGWVLDDHYPVTDWLVWQIGRLWLYALLFSAACVSVGHVILHRVLRLRSLPVVEHLVTSMMVGVVAFVLALYLAGALGLLRPWLAVFLPALFLALGYRSGWPWLREHWQRWRAERRPLSPIALVAALGGGACVALLYLQSLTPDSITFDATWYHIPIAQDYARHGAIVAFPGDYNRAFPHLTSMVYLWGFLVPGLSTPLRWMMALHLELTLVVWTLVGVAATTRWLLADEPVRSTWAAFFLFPAIFVWDQNLGGAADHVLGFFVLPFFLALARALKERFDWRFCALVGVAVGGAVLTKYQAIYFVGFGAVLVIGRWLQLLVRHLRDAEAGPMPWRRLWVGPLVIAAVGLVVASPHFVKNALFYHNPLYPLAQGLFTGSQPAHEKSKFFFDNMYATRQWLPQGEGFGRVTEAVKLFFTYSFDPHYSRTKGVPAIGSLYTLLLPCLLFLKGSARIWLAVAAGFVAMQVWAHTYVVDRYLQALVPLFVATTAAIMVRLWQQGWLARAGLVPLVALQLMWGGDALFYSGHKRLTSAVSLIRSGYEGRRSDDRRFPYRSAHRQITKATPEDARILVRNYRTTLGIDRDILFDIQPWQGLIYYEPVDNLRDLYELYQSRGVTHLLYPRGQRPSVTKQINVLFAAFVHRHCPHRRAFGSLWLADMPTTPPPKTDQPLMVLVSGMAGFRDGLYRVDQLAVYERLPREQRRRPRPIEPLAKNPDALRQRADVALLGRRSPLARGNALGPDFAKAERFKHFAIYVRNEVQPATPEDGPSAVVPASFRPH